MRFRASRGLLPATALRPSGGSVIVEPSDSRPSIVTALLVAVAFAILIASTILLRQSAAGAFADEMTVRVASATAETALSEQLDEETGIRGYQVDRRESLLQPYRAARPLIGGTLASLATDLGAAGVDAEPALRARAIAARWQRDVADAVFARRNSDVALLTQGKSLVDAFRVQISQVRSELDVAEAAIDRRRRDALTSISLFSGATIAALALAALVFVRRQRALERGLAAERRAAQNERVQAAGLRAAYEAEKRIADSLQDAIAQRPLPLHPTLRFSATYVPATDESRVGGDWYDAIELPQNRVLFAIGDVTGHGLPAAVAMSRARQSLIMSALYDSEPAHVLSRVNDDLLGQNAPMVTAVAGFADARSYEFVYASAGHPPPVLLEPNRPPRMLNFGGVPLGVVGGASFATHRIQSVPGAMLVLYTDGAIEHSRDVLEGETQLLAAVARAGETDATDLASVIHEGIFHGHPAGDDVAILTIGFDDGRTGALRISADDAQTSVASRIERSTDGGGARNRLRRGGRPLAGLRRAS